MARAEAGVAASDAAILKAEANVTRTQAVLAQRDVDVAAAELTGAESDVAVIRAQAADARAALLYEQTLLAHHDLIAPFDSVVVHHHAEAGTVVRAVYSGAVVRTGIESDRVNEERRV